MLTTVICRPCRLVLPLLLSLAGAAGARGQILFNDDFETDRSDQWSVFDGAVNFLPDFTVDWAFDYSTVRYVSNGATNFIPPAPSGPGTRGVRLTVNNNDDVAAAAAVNLYTRQAFSGDYAVKFDVWMNYNGGAYGGTGSTEHAVFGVNHAADKVVWANNLFPADGIFFGMAGEAGAGTAVGDYSAYVGDGSGAFQKLANDEAGFPDRDGDGVIEAEVNPNQPPTHPIKLIFPNPPHESAGAPGKQWVRVELRHRVVEGQNRVTWLLNGHVFADHTLGTLFEQTSGAAMIGYMDLFNSIASPRADNFLIYDNFRVEDLTGKPNPPEVTIAATVPEAAEPSTPGRFTLTRTGDVSQPLTVGLRVIGTATPGVDYVALPTNVVFAAGSATAELVVQPLDDLIGEPDETVTVVLLGSTEYDLRASMAATVVIKDDGDVPLASLSVVRAGAYEPRADRPAVLRLNLVPPADTALTISLAYSGAAANGVAYQPLMDSITLAAGQTEALLEFVPIDNAEFTGDRQATVTVQPGAGYAPAPSGASASITIRDDEREPGTLAYSESFETDVSANWNVNLGPTDGVAEFGFDYSTVGIPPAPGATTTRGLKLQANQFNAVFGGLSVSPKGQHFTGDWRLRYYVWQNYNGPLPLGGLGSTQITGAGVGTAGTTPQWPGGTHDSVWFAATGDGGSGVDYRAYSSAAPGGYGDASGVFAAGTGANVRNNDHPYYAEFGGVPVPAAQLALFPNQTGTSLVGTMAFDWRDVVIEKRGGLVSWFIDGLRIATVDTAGVNLGGGNFHLAYSDINAGVSGDPDAVNLLFGLFDNVRVELLSAPAGPAEITAVGFVNQRLRITFKGAATDTPAAFQIVTAASVNGPYTPDAGATGTITQTAPGEFQAEVNPAGDAKFVQVAR